MPRSRLACFALLCILAVPASIHAEIIHVTPTGLSTGAGTPADPVDLVTGFSRLDPGDAMRIAGGSYGWSTGPLPVPGSVTIEGGFVPGATWKKDLTIPTTITVTPPLQTVVVGPATVGYYAGLNLVSKTDVTITDLVLSVVPGGASGTFGSRGLTVYSVRMQSCENVSFNRVQFNRGAASGGLNGQPGVTGGTGSNAVSGGAGNIDNENACGLGGAGGAGGGAGSSTPSPSVCALNSTAGLGNNGAAGSVLRMGGSGGSGGSGGAASYFLGGFGGVGGAGGSGVSGGSSGGRGTISDCLGSAGGAAFNGNPGANGNSFTAGNRPGLGPANRDVYFVPGGQAASGGDGAGGSGGGG